ncbi:hypothetical protein PV327_006003 [Microctonus hyperodae]|uniref:CFA20 domain-containing protein n=1 Tax=Microctonus hyperodae TaxID=165561 RepID=A0AA39G2L0_MICHY|nr:hypothetical protein PV327_006003 [Microctonus hyperodae]
MTKFPCSGFESLLCSINERPLQLWCKYVALEGSIKRVEDTLLNGDKVIEIIGKSERSNCKDYIATSISCPAESTNFLNINLPVLIFVIKNLKREGKIEFQLVDQSNFRRRIVLITNTTREKIPKVSPTSAFLPFVLEEDWNILEIDLRNLCLNVYGTEYQSLQRLIVHPNFRIRRIYLQDRHYEHDETPKELYQALADLYALRRTFKYVDKNCQTNPPISVKKLSIIKPVKKKRKKNSEASV